MSRETLNTQFWKACKILRQDDNTNSLLDYVEQISWLLFLKCLEEVELKSKAEAEYEGRSYTPILAKKYQWSTWANPDKRLTGRDLISFLTDDLFPYLRNLKGNSAKSVIRALFEENPSKMLKDGGILRDAIDEICKIEFETTDDVHTLSHLYESMLAKLGREGGMGGEFYTPRPIIEFVVQMVNPKIGETVYDPAMGSAGFLVEAYKHMQQSLGRKILPRDEKKLQEETFYGQEKKPLPYLLGCMNMILHGVFSSKLIRKNTLGDDVRKFTEKDRFDVILTNPPFGGTEHDSVTSNFRYPSKATSITFLQHIMAKVKRGGRVGMVIDEGVLFKTNENAYVQTKKELLEQFDLHTIVSLPTGVFANAVASGTGPKTNLLFFDRELDKAGNPIGTKKIWYYDVSAVGFTLTKTQKIIAENDLPDCLNKAKKRKLSEQSWIVSVEDIIKNDYDLSANNPNAQVAVEHRSPSAITADIVAKEQKILDIMEEIQELLEPNGNSTSEEDE
jgi:type I restriction enzyme M protein